MLPIFNTGRKRMGEKNFGIRSMFLASLCFWLAARWVSAAAFSGPAWIPGEFGLIQSPLFNNEVPDVLGFALGAAGVFAAWAAAFVLARKGDSFGSAPFVLVSVVAVAAVCLGAYGSGAPVANGWPLLAALSAFVIFWSRGQVVVTPRAQMALAVSCVAMAALFPGALLLLPPEAALFFEFHFGAFFSSVVEASNGSVPCVDWPSLYGCYGVPVAFVLDAAGIGAGGSSRWLMPILGLALPAGLIMLFLSLRQFVGRVHAAMAVCAGVGFVLMGRLSILEKTVAALAEGVSKGGGVLVWESLTAALLDPYFQWSVARLLPLAASVLAVAAALGSRGFFGASPVAKGAVLGAVSGAAFLWNAETGAAVFVSTLPILALLGAEQGGGWMKALAAVFAGCLGLLAAVGLFAGIHGSDVVSVMANQFGASKAYRNGFFGMPMPAVGVYDVLAATGAALGLFVAGRLGGGLKEVSRRRRKMMFCLFLTALFFAISPYYVGRSHFGNAAVVAVPLLTALGLFLGPAFRMARRSGASALWARGTVALFVGLCVFAAVAAALLATLSVGFAKSHRNLGLMDERRIGMVLEGGENLPNGLPKGGMLVASEWALKARGLGSGERLRPLHESLSSVDIGTRLVSFLDSEYGYVSRDFLSGGVGWVPGEATRIYDPKFAKAAAECVLESRDVVAVIAIPSGFARPESAALLTRKKGRRWSDFKACDIFEGKKEGAR